MMLPKKMVLLIKFILIICIFTSTIKINVSACQSINYDYRKINNIAILFMNIKTDFFKNFKKNFIKVENENRDKVKFTFYDLQNNVSIQNESIDLATRSNFDLIIALLVDSTENTIKDIILKAKAKNIPLILMDIEPKVAESVSKYYDKVTFISFNPTESGNAQGKMIAKMWYSNKDKMDKNGDGILQYILLKGLYISDVANQRTKAVISTIKNSGIQTEELQLVHCDWSREVAKNAIQNLFLKYDGRIEAIISNSDDMAIGALEGLQTYGYNTGNKSKYIPIFGNNGVPEAKELVDKGLLAGTIYRDSYGFAKATFIIGMNLINDTDPLENTNYKIQNSEIDVLLPSIEYINNNIYK